MAIIKGITVTLIGKEFAGTDPFGASIFEDKETTGAIITENPLEKEISIFTTVMEKHMVKNRKSSRRYAG